MKKELISVLFANVVFLFINLSINFIIPKYVSIDTYSLIKTYALYISYAGLLHFGYNDGMYLKYGGKKIENINKEDLANNFINYIYLNLFVFIIIMVCSLLIHNDLLFAFAFGMVSCNIMNYLKSLYQATGKFKLYGIALNIDRIIVFILSIIALFILKSDNYLVFIWIQVFTGAFCTLLLIINLEKNLNFIKYGKFKLSEYKDNIKSGIVLLLGNFSNSFLTTMDRWFVKILLSTFDFAMYSLAASMENIISVVVSPITVTMYNYFCKNKEKKFIVKIKNMTLLYGFFVLTGAYLMKFILENFLTKYIAAIEIIFLLFGAQLFYVIIKGIYVNLYKATKRQKIYFYQLVGMIILGFVLNIVLFNVFKNSISIAMATFITSVIWFLSCELIDRELSFSIKEYLSIIIIICTYIITGVICDSILGLIIYVFVVLVISMLLMKPTVSYLFEFIHDKIKQTKKRKKKYM